jgi:hypothetical protein
LEEITEKHNHLTEELKRTETQLLEKVNQLEQNISILNRREEELRDIQRKLHETEEKLNEAIREKETTLSQLNQTRGNKKNVKINFNRLIDQSINQYLFDFQSFILSDVCDNNHNDTIHICICYLIVFRK